LYYGREAGRVVWLAAAQCRWWLPGAPDAQLPRKPFAGFVFSMFFAPVLVVRPPLSVLFVFRPVLLRILAEFCWRPLVHDTVFV
ncbi:hypothetical protein CWI44_03900, partial [Neisseria meningitidis]